MQQHLAGIYQVARLLLNKGLAMLCFYFVRGKGAGLRHISSTSKALGGY